MGARCPGPPMNTLKKCAQGTAHSKCKAGVRPTRCFPVLAFLALRAFYFRCEPGAERCRLSPAGGVLGSRRGTCFGGTLENCSTNPMTGFFRNGCCDTSAEDGGSHTVCVIVTEAFLKFSASCGNDLSTPLPEYGFPGLKEGDRWCLCAPALAGSARSGSRSARRAARDARGGTTYCALADLKRPRDRSGIVQRIRTFGPASPSLVMAKKGRSARLPD